ncbi:MAG: hypothetical protein ACXWUG_29770 [Polyangiales bacterium]
MKSHCGGTYSDGTCPPEERVARCKVTTGKDGDAAVGMIHFYGPVWTADEAKRRCVSTKNSETSYFPN